jgi:hypothetical protein
MGAPAAIRFGFWPPRIQRLRGRTIRSRHGQGAVESKDDGGHRFWTARYGRYAIRIGANRPGLYRWVITLEGRSIRKGSALAVTRQQTQ